jgi:chromosome transmission fidelity protein 18
MGNLLDVPIHRLMDELAAATAEKLDLDHHACVLLSASCFIFLGLLPGLTTHHSSCSALQTNPNVPHPKAKLAKAQETLWVDRYRPHRFTDLLGNERVAREIMAWVKEWDFCVFGKNRNRHRNANANGRNKVGGAGAPGGDGKEGEEGYGYDKEDEYRRPREKVCIFFLSTLFLTSEVYFSSYFFNGLNLLLAFITFGSAGIRQNDDGACHREAGWV